jgi:hypothetical protein
MWVTMLRESHPLANSHLLLAVGQIIGQVDAAIAVPDQAVNRFGGGDKAGLVHHGHGSLAKADNHVHRARFEQPPGDLSYLFSVSLHIMLPWLLL